MGLLDDIKAKLTEILGLLPKEEEEPAEDEKTPEETKPDEESDGERAIAFADIRDALSMKLAELDEYVWVHDLYLDGEEKFAVYSSGGKLFKMPVMVQGTEITFGTSEQVEAQFAPARERGSFSVARQADGKLRWFAVACSSVLNRVGEIDSTALFDSFTAHIAETGEYPELRFYHLPVRLGSTDWVARDGWLLLSSGLLDEENPVARVFADAVENKRGEWGISVGYHATSEPKRMTIADGVTVLAFDAGILREESVLLEKDAAALLTSITEMEVYRMNKAAKDAVLLMFGDGRKEEAEAFIQDVDSRNRSIEDSGMIKREDAAAETKPAEETPAETPAPKPTPEAERTFVLDEAAVNAIAERVRAALPVAQVVDLAPIQSAVDAMSKSVDALSGRIATLESGEDARKREYLSDMPARGEVRATYRPREDKAKTAESTKDGQPTAEELNAKAEATLAELQKKQSRSHVVVNAPPAV